MTRDVLSSWHGDLLEDFADDFADVHAFDFVFGAEDEAVADDGFGELFYVVRRDEIAAVERGVRAGGEQQGLRGSWACSDEDAFGGAGGADDIDEDRKSVV